MNKIAVLFSGQGAQKPGMGASLYEGDGAARAVLDRLFALDGSLKRLLLDAPQEELNETKNTQRALFAMSMASFAALGESFAPAAMAGFSLGEYAAVAASGMLPLEQAYGLVRRRAEWMQECAEATRGGMAAVLGKDGPELDELIGRCDKDDFLIPVNYNCPGQTVVAGDEATLERFVALCKSEKVRAMRLPVNGAFHSKYMAPAAEKIRGLLGEMQLGSPACTVYANVTGEPYVPGNIEETLARQTMSPVRFRQAVRHMLDSGVDTFIEAGFGNTLLGFVKRTDKGARLFTADSAGAIAAIRNEGIL